MLGISRLTDRVRRIRKRRHDLSGLNSRSSHDQTDGRHKWSDMDTLEPRLLLTAAISEFLADNSTSITDEDGDHSDWIELTNTGDAPINLNGWHLTNDLGDLTQWTLPDQSINPGEFLVVFASTKDRANAGSELHTSFELEELGGDLALVRPDGTTIESQFANYPALGVDQSYGSVRKNLDATFIDNTTDARVLVPADDSLGSTWTSASFDDSALAGWIQGTGSVGYDTSESSDAFDVNVYYSAGTINSLATADTAISGVNNRPGSPVNASAQVLDYVDAAAGNAGNFSLNNPFPGLNINIDDFALRATATIFISGDQAGDWTFGTNADDGVRLRIDGNDIIVDNTLHPPQDRFGTVNLTAGTHEIDAVFFERGGGAAYELFAAPGTHNAFNANFDLVGDPNGNLPLVSLQNLVTTDIEAEMFNQNASAYVRYPFDVINPNEVGSLSADVTYDDGFIAYLNGVQIDAVNEPASPTFDSTSTIDDGFSSTTIDLTPHLGLLTAGENVLAFHLLNANASDNEVLIAPEVNGRILGLPNPETFDIPTPGATNGLLDPVITEFQASNQSTLDDEDGDSSDWIEIHNPGAVDADISGMFLTDDALELTKWRIPDGTILAAGEYKIIFASEKDRTNPLSELHTNFRLSAGGEYLALVAADGVTPIFEYQPGGTDYPQQFEDVSFGLRGGASEPVDPGDGEGAETFVGLVAYYDFEDGAGTTVTDKSGNGFDGTITNPAGTTWTSGQVGSGALNFTGTGHVQTSATPLDLDITGASERTVSFWTKLNSSSQAGFFEFGQTPDQFGFKHTFSFAAFSLWSMQLGNTATSRQLPAATNGNWAHMAITYDGSEAQLYYNGAPFNAPVAVDLNTSDGGELTIGRLLGNSDYRGDIDEFAIWDVALDPATIADLHSGTHTPLSAPVPISRPIGIDKDGFTVTQRNASPTFPGEVTGEVGSGADPLSDADLLLSLPDNDPGIAQGLTVSDISSINFFEVTGGGSNGEFGNNEAFILDDFASDDNHFALRATANLVVPAGAEGKFEFKTTSDEGVRLRIDGIDIILDNSLHTAAANTGIANLTAGDHTLELVYFENVGGATLELSVRSLTASDEPQGDFQLLTILPDQQQPDVPPNPLDAPRVFFSSPTPGEANNQGVEFFVGPTTLSVGPGIYDTPFDLELINETPGVEIRYTLDGTDPTETTGTVYTGPLNISGQTNIRAKAFLDGADPSTTVTGTYIFLDDVIAQPKSNPGFPTGSNALEFGMDTAVTQSAIWGPQMEAALTQIPSISFTMDLDDFGHIYHNPGQRGRAFEVPVNVQFIDPTEGLQTEIDAGVRVRGGFSRSTGNPKHAFRLFFRSEYGEGRLNYPLFGDEGTDSYNSLDIRTSQNYSWAFQNNNNNTFLRDVVSRDMQRDLGEAYTRSRFYHLYINGQYWGLFQTEERFSDDYAESYLGGDEEDYDVSRTSGSTRTVNFVSGTDEKTRDLHSFFVQPGGLGDANVDDYFMLQGLNPDGTPNPEFERLLDVDNLIHYMMITYYTSDADGPGSEFTRPGINNYYFLINRENPDGMKHFEHDSEHSFDTGGAAGANYNMVSPFVNNGADFNRFNGHWMHEQLASTNSEYRQRFIDRVTEEFLTPGGIFTTPNVLAMIDSRAAEFDDAIIAESARWGNNGQFTKTTWEQAVQRMKDFVQGTGQFAFNSGSALISGDRAEAVVRQLQAVDWYPEILAPRIQPDGGAVTPGTEVTLSTVGETITVNTDTVILDGTPGTSPVHYFVPSAASPVDTVWFAEDFDPVAEGWTAGTNGVGYDNNPDYIPLIGAGSNVRALFTETVETSVYITSDFTVADASAIDELILDIHYDDAFVLYINGEEAVRSTGAILLGSPPLWNDVSIFTVGDTQGIDGQEYVLTDMKHLLKDGVNRLAIHGMNTNLTSSDLIILPELISRVSEEITLDSVGQIWYTLDGSDPRGVGGDPGPTAISYNQLEDFVLPGDSGSYLVPTNDPSEADWQLPSYVENASWKPATTGIGFDTNEISEIPGFTMRVVDTSGDVASLGIAQDVLGANNGGLPITSDTVHDVAYINHGDPAGLQSPAVLAMPGTADKENYAVRATANVTIPAGTWTISFGSDDGGEIHIPGVTFTNKVNEDGATGDPEKITFAAPRGYGITSGTFTLTEPLQTTLTMDFYERGGGDTWEVAISNGGARTILQDGTLGWTVRTTGADVDFTPAITTDIEADVHDVNSSVYLRMPFNVTDANDVTSVLFSMQYDDGYVAYINGTKIAEANAPATPLFNSVATDTRSDVAVLNQLDEVGPIPNINGLLVEGQNVLGIHVLNISADDVDLLATPTLTATRGAQPFQINESGPVRARTFHQGEWSPIAEAFFLTGEQTLSVSEIHYNPAGPSAAEELAGFLNNDDFEYIELVNNGLNTVSLGGARFTDGIQFDFTGSDVTSLDPGERVIIVKNKAAFESRHGTGHNVAGEYLGSLDNGGETLALVDALGDPIQSFTYNDAGSFPTLPDGNGPSLVLIDYTAIPGTEPEATAFLNDGTNWRPSFEVDGNPGIQGADLLTDIVVNEVLAHSNLPNTDFVEILNRGTSPVDISGWFISDAAANLGKFEIPAATILNPGEYITFDETDFNPSGGVDAGDFAFSSSNGDQVFLTVGVDGVPVGYADVVDFGASFPDESFGRWPNGTGELIPQLSLTPGADNSGPRFGPLIISEIMYNPPAPTQNELDNFDPNLDDEDFEFVEIHNPTGTPVNLENWQLRKGVDIDFDITETIGPLETIVVVTFNPTNPDNSGRLDAFRARYGIGNEVTIYGGFSGQLDNGGETVDLKRPDNPTLEGEIPRGIEDRAVFDDESPWPTPTPDGLGDSIHRTDPQAFGVFASSWTAGTPTPGSVNFVAGTPEVDVHLVPRRTPTAFDTSGALPTHDGPDADFWQREQNQFSVEVWVKVDQAIDTFTSGSIRVDFDNTGADAVAVDHGSVFDLNPSMTINSGAGFVEFGGDASQLGLGSSEFVKLGTILFDSKGDIDASTSAFGPYALNLSASDGPTQFQLAVNGATDTDIQTAPDAEVRAVPYDIDNNNIVNFADLGFFLPAVGENPGGSQPPFTNWADFNGDNIIDSDDLDLLTEAFGKSFVNPTFTINPNAPTEGSGGGGGGAGGIDVLAINVDDDEDDNETGTPQSIIGGGSSSQDRVNLLSTAEGISL